MAFRLRFVTMAMLFRLSFSYLHDMARHSTVAARRRMLSGTSRVAFVQLPPRTSVVEGLTWSIKGRTIDNVRTLTSLQLASNVLLDEEEEDVASYTDDLLHPNDIGPIPIPKTLSPSSILEFKACPQSFLFQYLYNLKRPSSLALAKGSMCHEALEKVFDLDPNDRTLEHLQNLLRVSWSEHRLTDTYRHLFETQNDVGEIDWDIPSEREWGQSALQLLHNYYQLEDPRTIQRPNPMQREIWLHSYLTVDPTLGLTGYMSSDYSHGDNLESEQLVNRDDSTPTFRVRGIVDRIDMVRLPSGKVALRIVDYKTGKSPTLKYSKPVNERIVEEAFYQLKIYALLLREKGAGKAQPKPGVDLRQLRLFYLTSETGPAKYIDLDLGETQEERDKALQEIHKDLSNVWQNILDLVATQDPKAFVGCDRSFCYCHECRARFIPGTLWEPS